MKTEFIILGTKFKGVKTIDIDNSGLSIRIEVSNSKHNNKAVEELISEHGDKISNRDNEFVRCFKIMLRHSDIYLLIEW